jgi:predicted regulator of Ras-like GTPase activity (Roadblock/LC7/MglB family)
MAGEDRQTVTAAQAGMDPLKQALGGYLAIPGIKAALLVSDQGLLVSSMAHEGVDIASIAALAVDTVASAQRFGQAVKAGTLDTMSIEFEGLTIVFAPFTPDVMLALLAAPGTVGILLGQLSGGHTVSAGSVAPPRA